MNTMRFFWMRWGWVLLLLGSTATPPPPPVHPITITWPEAEAVVHGQVLVQGRTAVPNFQKAVLDFQPLPPSSPSATPMPRGWIPLATLTEPVVRGFLTAWDTQTLPEGPYVLRLRVFLRTGDVLTYQVRVWVGTRPDWVQVTPRAAVTPPAAEVPLTPETPSMPGTPTPRPWPVAVEPWVPTPSSPHGGNPATWHRALWLGAFLGVGLVALYWWANARRA